MMARRKPFGDHEKLAACLHGAGASGPGFIKQLEKKPAQTLVPNKEMWQKLVEIQPNLSFTKTAVEQALKMVEAQQTTWPKKFSTDAELNEWVKVAGGRLRAQCRFITQTQLKRPSTKWLQLLWSKEPPPGGVAEAEAEAEAEDEEINEDDLQEESEEECGETQKDSHEKDSEAQTNPEKEMKQEPAGNVFWGFDHERKKAWKKGPGDKLVEVGFMALWYKEGAADVDNVMCTWPDKSQSQITDVTVAELKNERACSGEGKRKFVGRRVANWRTRTLGPQAER